MTVSLEMQNKIMKEFLKERVRTELVKRGSDALDPQDTKTSLGRFAKKHGFNREEVLATAKPIIEEAVKEFLTETATKLNSSIGNLSFTN